MRKIVVTGGAGFIGSHLVDGLLARHADAEIHVIDVFTRAARMANLSRAIATGRLIIHQICITDRHQAGLILRGADALFHLAAESHVPHSFLVPALFDRVNHKGTGCVLEAAHAAGIARVMHMSTDEVYGPLPVTADENHALRPTTPYAQSKADAESLVAQFRRQGMDVLVMRPSNIVGTRQHREKLLPRFVGHVLAGLPMPIEGSGAQRRSFLPVGDAVEAILLAFAKAPRNATYNLAARETLTVREVGEAISAQAGVEARFTFVADRPVNDCAYMINGDALAALGFRQKNTLADEIGAILRNEGDGLAKLIAAEHGKPSRAALAAPPLAPDLEILPFHVPHTARHQEAAVVNAMRSGRYAGGGAKTIEAERKLRALTGAKHVWLTHSCTAAMEIAALALSLDRDSEVVVPSFTFAATATAMQRNGANVVFADINPATMMMEPSDAEERLTERTRAVAVVHYGGFSAKAAEIAVLCAARGIAVIEDAAQAVGVRRNGRAAGTHGLFGAYSFHETKIIHGGHGGALLLNEDRPDLVRAIERILNRGTNFGEARARGDAYYEWTGAGSSYRPSEMQAALIGAQLDELADVIAARRRICAIYSERLAPLDGRAFTALAADGPGNGHFYALLMRSPQDAESLIAALARKGISAQSHYKPLHLSLGAPSGGKDCPHAAASWRRLVRLPVHTEMTENDALRAAQDVLDHFAPAHAD